MILVKYLLIILYVTVTSAGLSVGPLFPISDIRRHNGESITLNCSISDPKDEVFLFRKFKDTPEYELATNSKRIIKNGHQFTIHNLGFHDNGAYSCKAISRDGTATSREIATVAIEKDIPIIQIGVLLSNVVQGGKPFIIFSAKSPVRVPISSTDKVIITLRLKGLQPVHAKWMKDNTEIKGGNPKGNVSSDGRKLILEPPFTYEDAGTYNVMACNIEGCILRGIQIFIFEPWKRAVFHRQQPDTGFDIVATKHLALYVVPPVVILLATLLVFYTLKRKGILFKKRRLERERRKMTSQLRRGSNKHGSPWGWRQNYETSSSESEGDRTDYDDLEACRKSKRDEKQHRKKKRKTKKKVRARKNPGISDKTQTRGKSQSIAIKDQGEHKMNIYRAVSDVILVAKRPPAKAQRH